MSTGLSDGLNAFGLTPTKPCRFTGLASLWPVMARRQFSIRRNNHCQSSDIAISVQPMSCRRSDVTHGVPRTCRNEQLLAPLLADKAATPGRVIL